MSEPVGELVSRRVALQRAAQLGIAVAAMTPVAQGLGRVAAFASESDVPGQYRPPSNFQVEFTVSGQGDKKFALKFDPEDRGWDAGWDLIGPGGSCFAWVSQDAQKARKDSEPYIPSFSGTVSSVQEGGKATGWLFAPPTTGGIAVTNVMMKDGSFQDQCMAAVRDGSNYVIRVLEPGSA